MTTQFFLAHGPYASGLAAIEETGDDGVRARAQLGERLVREVGAMFQTLGMQLGYRYEVLRSAFPMALRRRPTGVTKS